jgi:hypothetical protein
VIAAFKGFGKSRKKFAGQPSEVVSVGNNTKVMIVKADKYKIDGLICRVCPK